MKNKSPQKPVPPQLDVDDEPRDDAIIGRALVISLFVFLVLALVGGVAAYVLTRPAPPPPVVQAEQRTLEVRQAPKAEIPRVPFVDITQQAGIDFVHESGAAGQKLLPETMGSGCAFLDYDNDGDQDLLLVNSSRWTWDERPAPESPATSRLYQNDGTGNFTDVTAEVGLDVPFYGMGVAMGDYDNDGYIDLFFSAVGPNRLFRNVSGKFQDVTGEAGVAGAENQWSTSSGWLDYDRDGDLDLFVCNYVQWSKELDLGQDFRLVGVGRAYGPPTAFGGTYPYLYRNEGEGKFTDVSSEAGVQVQNTATGVPAAKSMGLAPVDLDGDGWLDIVVSNDTVQNFLFHNQQGKGFEEMGALVGIAFDSSGQARGAMGIDAARFRNNADLGVAIGNFANEMSALYVSQQNQLQFVDSAIATGLGPATRLELTFGLFFFDYDLDGRLDLLGANGHLEHEINKVQASQHYEQPPQLFWNAGPEQSAEFVRVPPEKCGEDFVKRMVGRGAAYADIDSDGDLDVLLTASGGPPRLLRNDQQLGHHWLRLKLQASGGNRDAIGAWVEVHLDDVVLRHQVMPTRSYLSQVELPVTFGLGEADSIERIVIHWPDGSIEELPGLPVDAYHVVQQSER